MAYTPRPEAPGLESAPGSYLPTSSPSSGPRTFATTPSPPTFAGAPLVLLPTLNEEAGLRSTLQELQGVPAFAGSRRPTVLVVDGHSTDRTRDVARELGARLIVQRGHGKGSAVREGLEWAREHGFDSVCALDADGTYPCARLPPMIRLLEEEADVVAGVRRPTEPSDATARNLVHRVGNGLLNLCAAEFSGGPILDVCTGFWGIRTSVAETLALESTGFEVESELFVKAMRRGLRVVQIPVDYRPRIGVAKLHAARDGARILLSILRHARPLGAPTAPRSGGPAVPRRSSGPLPAARALNTVLSAFQATGIVVVAGRARLPEAVAVARSVEAERLGATTSTVVSFPEPGGRDVADEPADLPHDRRTVVITLPDPVSGLPGPGSTFVRSPTGARTLLIEPGGSPSSSRRRRFVRGLLADRRADPGHAPGALAILRATLDASGVAREMALVAANTAGAGVRVREAAPSWRRRTISAGLGPAFQSPPITSGVTGRV